MTNGQREILERLLEVAKAFSRIEADDGDNFEGVHEDVILRVEITAGDLHRLRDAIIEMESSLKQRPIESGAVR